MNGAVLITGGARRLGAALSRAIAAARYRVVIHANRSTDEGKALAEELGGVFVQGDLADPATPERLIREAMEKAGPLLRWSTMPRALNTTRRVPSRRNISPRMPGPI